MYKAFGKINLGLVIVGKKENGYHELDMVMAKIDLFDEIYIEKDSKDSFQCSRKDLENESNLVVQVYQYLKKTYRFKNNYKIYLKKNIPTQAGLGGGSSDCACIINTINDLEKLNLTLEEKIKIACLFGSDITFFLYNYTYARVKGQGEIITPIASKMKLNYLLIMGEQGVSTKKAFQNFRILNHKDLDSLENTLISNNKKQLYTKIHNDLQEVSIAINSEIQKNLNLLAPLQARFMSGSGASVVGLDSMEKIKTVYSQLINRVPFIYYGEIK